MVGLYFYAHTNGRNNLSVLSIGRLVGRALFGGRRVVDERANHVGCCRIHVSIYKTGQLFEQE